MIRFKCVDLDGNGVLTRNELQFFYEEQLHRMECMAQEPVLFEDILCQIIDMVRCEVCFSIFLLSIVWSCFIMSLGIHIRWKMMQFFYQAVKKFFLFMEDDIFQFAFLVLHFFPEFKIKIFHSAERKLYHSAWPERW